MRISNKVQNTCLIQTRVFANAGLVLLHLPRPRLVSLLHLRRTLIVAVSWRIPPGRSDRASRPLTHTPPTHRPRSTTTASSMPVYQTASLFATMSTHWSTNVPWSAFRWTAMDGKCPPIAVSECRQLEYLFRNFYSHHNEYLCYLCIDLRSRNIDTHCLLMQCIVYSVQCVYSVWCVQCNV